MYVSSLPVVIIGAGPVGLAAAAHLHARGLIPLVLESGDRVGAGMRHWSHVRMFSAWEFNVDKVARSLLTAEGWQAPDPAQYPTGGELVAEYLEPLAATAVLAPQIRVRARVISVTKRQRDRMKSANRDGAAFVVRYTDGVQEIDVPAQAVIDASGTMESPNPLGAAGIPALGERAVGDRVFYGMPDVLGADRTRYAGRRVLVIGSGHSAFNVLTDLARLRLDAPATRIAWAVRRPSLRRVLGGGENDQLKERGRLGLRIAKFVEEGVIAAHTAVHVDRIEATTEGLVVWSNGTALPPVDEIVAATGFRPDLSMLDEVRLDLDPGTQSPRALAPLIDPNLHSCGSVRPHGALELKHPDPNLYIVGMKSYGRAPTFLLLTGYEQVRSIAAAIAGDWDAARRVELLLPETGVCNTQFGPEEIPPAANAGCCGGPAIASVDACCVADANAKASGKSGCGCGPVGVAVTAPALANTLPAKVATCCGPACA